jgi:hypothetical protein
MAKPNPFYTNEKEKQELIERRDTFTFDSPDAHNKLVVLIAGKEGSGKTHLACTISEHEPVYLIDTEYRGGIVAKKFKNTKLATVKNYTDLVVAVKHILMHQPPGTIVIDSASDLQVFAEIEYLERTKKESIYPIFNWADVWALCNAVIDDIKFSKKFNLVLTTRVKEEYIGDKPTGKIVPRIYSTLPYKSDVVMQFENDKERTVCVTKNGFTGQGSRIVNPNSLNSLLQQLRTIPQPTKSMTTLRKVS